MNDANPIFKIGNPFQLRLFSRSSKKNLLFRLKAGSFSSLILGSLLFLFFPVRGAHADLIGDQLNALQQLRTLIPERLWAQEFSLIIDEKGFDRAAEGWKREFRAEGIAPFSYSMGGSNDYFLYSTMSGENIRILDLYQQFEESPFWKTADALERLHWLESD